MDTDDSMQIDMTVHMVFALDTKIFYVNSTTGHNAQALTLAGAATHPAKAALVTAYTPAETRRTPLGLQANQRRSEEQIRTGWAGGQAMTLRQATADARSLTETSAP